MEKYVTIETLDSQKLQGFLISDEQNYISVRIEMTEMFSRVTVVYKIDIKKITIHKATPAPKNDYKNPRRPLSRQRVLHRR